MATPRPRYPVFALLLTTAIVGTACGSSDDPTPRRDPDPAPPRGSADTRRAGAGPCTAVGGVRTAPLTVPRAAAREEVDSAAARSTATGHRFVTDLVVASGALRARATLAGRRLPDGSSTASLRWRAPASLVLDDQQLRIVGDEIASRAADTPRDAWAPQGSAAGVALDVGRELLMHPQLLRARAGSSSDGATTVDYAAPVGELRAHATTERRGPVTNLLRTTRRLTISATGASGRLVTDRFVLVATVPTSVARGPIRAGAPVTIRGATTYCPLPEGR